MEMHDYNQRLRPGKYDRKKYILLRDKIKSQGLVTVCMEADCPNRYECFSNGTATFMILGDTCTRGCRYCNVKKGNPSPPDKEEPKKIALMASSLNLRYVVLTCVTRDDLPDGGAGHFVETVYEIRKLLPQTKIELLISDMNRNMDSLKTIVQSDIYILNHNIETVRRIFGSIRPKADYDSSLSLLKHAKILRPKLYTKSGLMVGLGETIEEIEETMAELRANDCDFLSVGQYLQPNLRCVKTKKYYSDEEFEKIKEAGLKLGFRHIESGPLVRSSYNAHKYT